jgi:hypothetical protein
MPVTIGERYLPQIDTVLGVHPAVHDGLRTAPRRIDAWRPRHARERLELGPEAASDLYRAEWPCLKEMAA